MKIDNLNKNSNLKKVEKFIEKPPKSIAVKFFEDKKFVWNSGIFWKCKIHYRINE